jgi:putative phosphoesterase
LVRLGVVADSHIPDRMRALPPAAFEALAGVDAILHAGDICVQRVLDALAEVAPVYAVRGNRDLALRLPLDRELTFDGVRLGLTHGHGGLRQYMGEKVLAMAVGYYHTRFLRQVRARFGPVQAVVFGHSHRPVNFVMNGVLMFNPGSLGPDYRKPHGPAVGVLTIDQGVVRGQIIRLDGPAGWYDDEVHVSSPLRS